MLYVPELSLIPEGDGEYSLLAMTPVLSPSFSAEEAIPGPPESVPALADAVSFQLPIRFDASIHAADLGGTELHHRIPNLKLEPGTPVFCYVTLGGAIVGESSTVLGLNSMAADVRASASPSPSVSITRISAQECLGITIAATPAKKASSSAQQLHELGVVDDNQTRKHQDKIATAMAARGSSIDPALVNSGPNVTVAACAQSVFMMQGR